MTFRAWTQAAWPRSVARWGFGILVIVAVALSIDVSTLWARLLAADLRLAAVGVVGLTAAHLISAATWRILVARISGRRLAWWRAATQYYAAQAIGGVTPANLGGDVYRVHAMRSSGEGLDAALAPVVIQRATSYLALSLLGGAALLLLAWQSEVGIVLAVPAAAVAIAGMVVAALVLFAPDVLARLRLPVGRLLGTPAARDVSVWRATVARATAEGLAMGIVFHLVSVLLTAVLVLAVTPGAVPPAAVAAIAVARLTLAIPISPSGLGFQEGALSALFVGIGMAPETALAALLLARLSLLTTTLLGAAALLAGRATQRSSQSPAAKRTVSTETVVR